MTLPTDSKDLELHEQLRDAGLEPHKQGASCTFYRVPGTDRKYLYVSWNHIDLNGIRLPTVFPGRGEVLTALQLFWFHRILCGENNHLIAWGQFIYDYLPVRLRGYGQLHKQAFLVRAHHVSSVEQVAYGCLVGDLWKKYAQGGSKELSLPPGLRYGARLRHPIILSGKPVESANDPPGFSDPCLQQMAARIYSSMASHALERGVMMPFCRFRFGVSKIIAPDQSSTFIPSGALAGQPGTPDTAEFYDASLRRRTLSAGEKPDTCDRHVLMKWLRTEMASRQNTVEIDKLNPSDQVHRDLISELTVPPDVVNGTMYCLRCLFGRLTSQNLPEYQKLASM